VQATFFVVGSMAAANPAIVRRASTQGHQVGTHAWSHPNLTTLSRTEVLSQLARTIETIQQATDPARGREHVDRCDPARRARRTGPPSPRW
jgi:peptidoglycan/xylan/chitin deacetylase (PgdA/CDA1 family)